MVLNTSYKITFSYTRGGLFLKHPLLYSLFGGPLLDCDTTTRSEGEEREGGTTQKKRFLSAKKSLPPCKIPRKRCLSPEDVPDFSGNFFLKNFPTAKS